MKRAQKDARLEILTKTSKILHGSGIDGSWDISETKQGIWMSNSFHCMDSSGYYCGWADFSYFFPWSDKLIDFKLMFHGPQAQYLARKQALRSYLEDSIVHFLPEDVK